MDSLNSNPNSHLTAKERDKISYPARILWEAGKLKGNILDFGCGFGTDAKLLRSKGFSIDGYDPHYAPTLPAQKYDTIICLYVLNVLFPDEQHAVIQQVTDLLNPGGHAYFAVRRDIRYEGFRTHKIHQKPTYQCNVVLDLPSLFVNDFCEIYVLEKQGASHTPSVCPFCNLAERPLLAENRAAIAILDKYPVSPGHTLVIPRIHEPNFLDLPMTVQEQCLFLVNYVRHKLEEEYKPQGFNIGINVGETAGQTIGHAHIHVIPRYEGDVEDPRGGVRRLISGMGAY